MVLSLIQKFSFFNSSDIAIDLGTANTLIWTKSKGIVLNEPSFVARDTVTNKVMAVGQEAKKMLGRTHGGIEVIRPLKDGVIADVDITNEMIQYFIKKINIGISRPRIVICVPSGCSDLEVRAVKDAAENANGREVYLITEPMAAAIGLGIDVSSPEGHMIVDIGGGTTEVAVIALNGIVSLQTIEFAGDKQTNAIVRWLHDRHQLEIGEQFAEEIKNKVGSAMIDRANKINFTVHGRNIMTGIPREIQISNEEIAKALNSSVSQICDAIKQALDKTPPQHSSDIINNGIILTGGGSLLDGLDIYIRNVTGLPVNVSEDPLLSVVKGTGMVLENIKKYEQAGILINT